MTSIVLVLGLLTVRGSHEISTMDHLSPKLVGEMVTVSYVANPAIGHGRFRLENHGSKPLTAEVETVWLELGEKQQPLVDITVFNLRLDEMVNPAAFMIDAGSTETFLVGFPRIAYEPRFGIAMAVGLQLSINGIKLVAHSPVNFERRYPYNS